MTTMKRRWNKSVTHQLPPYFTPSNELHASSDSPSVVHTTIRTDRNTREMDHRWWTEVACAGTCLVPTIIRVEDVDVATFISVIHGHQRRSCISGNPKLHWDDATRFLCIKSEEFVGIELYNMRSGRLIE